MKLTVFIQTNQKQLLGARVAAHALRRSSDQPQAFDVRIVEVEDFPALHNRDGQSYLRAGKAAIWRNDDLQSFTPTRFLPPQLAGFQGRAVVIDPDVFALADVMDLLSMEMSGKAILCRHIVPNDGREPYWATSVMLLDCAKLAHWQWERCIEEMFSFSRDYRDWMSLLLEPQETVGVLDEFWNHYDQLDSRTKMLHNTGRLTQPWKTGLAIDFTREPRDGAAGDRKWGVFPRAWIRRAKSSLAGTPYRPEGHYQSHPDKRQEQLFFSLLKECVDSGQITLKDLEREISHNHIRHDAIRLLSSA
jgi:hypothetical protein